MGSITITADDHIVEQAREYAARHRISLNEMVCDWLASLVPQKDEDSCWTKELEAAIEAAQGNSRGQTWKREELYRV